VVCDNVPCLVVMGDGVVADDLTGNARRLVRSRCRRGRGCLLRGRWLRMVLRRSELVLFEEGVVTNTAGEK